MASDPAFSPQLKLHSLSWLFALTTYVKQFIFPVVAFAIFGARNDGQLWGLLVIIPLLFAALWQQWLYRYGFGPRGLVINEGLFFRNVRQIEYPRIENIDVKRGLLHRLLGVAEVSIATSTGGKAEATIRVLSLDATQELRDHVFQRAQSGEAKASPSEADDEMLLKLPPSELVRYGLIDNRGMIIVAAVIGFLVQAEFYEYFGKELMQVFSGSVFEDLVALGIAMQAALAVGSLITIIVGMRVLSIIFALVTLFDFTLTKHDQDFRVRHGLITRLALTLRVRRIQSVHQTETLLHRLFGRVSLRVDLAGDTHTSSEDQQKISVRTRWLAPICTPAKANELTAMALPDIDRSIEPDWQPLAAGARGRIFRGTLLFAILVSIPATVALHLLPDSGFKPGDGYIISFLALMVPIGWWRARVYVKYTRWALTPDAVLFRRGWLTRRLTVTPRNRLQSTRLSTTPFDRRNRMATVSLDTAGGSGMSDGIHIRFLPREIARALTVRLYHSHIDRGRR